MIPPSIYLVMLKSGHILNHNFLHAVTSVGWCCHQILSPLCPQISNITSAIPSKLCCFSLHAFLPPLTPLSQNCPVVVNQLMYSLFQSLLFGTSIQPLSPPTGHFTMAFAQRITFPTTFSPLLWSSDRAFSLFSKTPKSFFLNLPAWFFSSAQLLQTTFSCFCPQLTRQFWETFH